MSTICTAGDLMAWTNEGRCCKLTPKSTVNTRQMWQPSVACEENVICHLHHKEAGELKDSWEISISWFTNQFAHTLWGLDCLHPSPSYASCQPSKDCEITKSGYGHLRLHFCQNYNTKIVFFFFLIPYSFSSFPSFSSSDLLSFTVPPALGQLTAQCFTEH